MPFEVHQFGQRAGEQRTARTGVTALEHHGHPPRDILPDIVGTSDHGVEIGEGHRKGVLADQIGPPVQAERVDHRDGDLLDVGEQVEQVDGVDAVHTRLPKARVGLPRTTQRVRSVLEHRQDRAVGGHILLPDSRVRGKVHGIVGDPHGCGVADHQRGRNPRRQFHRYERTERLAHRGVEPVWVGGELRGVQRNRSMVPADDGRRRFGIVDRGRVSFRWCCQCTTPDMGQEFDDVLSDLVRVPLARSCRVGRRKLWMSKTRPRDVNAMSRLCT